MNAVARCPFSASRAPRLLLIALPLLAFALRLWRLDSVPPGWRDDELINLLVISQKALDGDWTLYYPDASGNEALYHVLNAIMLALFGPNMLGFRLLSVILGTLAVPMTYALGRRLFGSTVGLVAAAALAFSFWSLMYSRFGLRQIQTPLLALAAFYFFWRGLKIGDGGAVSEESAPATGRSSLPDFLLAAVFMGLGFYTYFASRGVPLILLAFCAYLWLFDRPLFKRHWRGFALMFGATLLLAVPLLMILGQQPEAEARVSELAAPLIEARAGDFTLVRRHTLTTLSMFHSDGDDEWLYNIPHRPVFGLLGAVFFWSGVIISLWFTLQPLISRFTLRVLRRDTQYAIRNISPISLASAFLFFWWLAGISPGFISVPPASLGHTIVAQPAAFILAALPIGWLESGTWRLRPWPDARRYTFITVVSGLLLLGSIAWRDLPAYFQEWPQRGMVRFLYRADVQEMADYLNQRPDLVDFGVTGLLAGPWDKLALAVDLEDERATTARPRWYNPERAVLVEPPLSFFSPFPTIPSAYTEHYRPAPGEHPAGNYTLNQVVADLNVTPSVCFQNGLCLLTADYDPERRHLELGWLVKRRLDLPAMPLISNPPPPGVYAGPRLLVFVQLQDAGGNFLVGDDGLWVDPATLQAGDIFLQQHWLAGPAGNGSQDKEATVAVFGLYDPMNGERILTEDGRDHLRLEIGG